MSKVYCSAVVPAPVHDADEAEVCNSVMSLYHEGLEALRARFAAS